MPVKIERVRFHAAPARAAFSLTPDVKEFDATVLKVTSSFSTRTATASSRCSGLVCRPTGGRRQEATAPTMISMEALSPRPGSGVRRRSDHLPSPEVLAPLIQQESEILQQRLDRARFQNEFHSLVARNRGGLHRARIARIGLDP